MARAYDDSNRTVASNRRARHEYYIEQTFEAGLVLTGSEIKSVRAGEVSLQQAYATIESDEIWLVGAHIAEYQQAGYAGHEPGRRRKLLLRRKQIAEIARDLHIKGYTLVPLRLYLKDGWAKLEIGLGKGKKHFDKRETIRERDVQRDMDREMARRGR